VAGWRAHGGGDPTSYANELRWYATELAKDHYIHGATIYACGTYEDFASFDVGGVGDVESVVNEQIDGPPLGPPATPPSPLPEPEPLPLPTADATTELQRYAADLWKRAAGFTGTPIRWTKGHAISDHWVASLADNRFIGFPLEPAHDSEDGDSILQAFSSTIVRWDKATGEITEIGYRPLARGLS
jgi:hypothetical protein